LPVTLCATAYSQVQDHKAEAPFPHPVALEVSLDRSTFEAREPVIAHVTLTNRGRQPFRMSVREDGAPYGIALHVLDGDGSVSKHSLWIGRHGPQPRDIELAGGESTTGDILVLLDYGKEYVFPNPGLYGIVWRWYPGPGFAMMYTEEARVRVVPPSRMNEDFLEQLELIALRRDAGEAADTLDLSTPEAEKGLDRLGILRLGRIINEKQPYLIDPKDERELQFVASLGELLVRFPDSSYSGYVARFLGLVYFKTLEQDYSALANEQWDSERTRAHPAYGKALRYLTMAKDADVWPRTTALENLFWLQGLTQEWDKADQYVVTLREQYGDIGGATIAEKLQSEMERFRARLEARKGK